jgi:hypothetical protein
VAEHGGILLPRQRPVMIALELGSASLCQMVTPACARVAVLALANGSSGDAEGSGPSSGTSLRISSADGLLQRCLQNTVDASLHRDRDADKPGRCRPSRTLPCT